MLWTHTGDLAFQVIVVVVVVLRAFRRAGLRVPAGRGEERAEETEGIRYR